ncbi:hypothetical protein RHGRI_004691 [Rhododendron griersonianum]|uniref:ATP-dependent DNA helicase n=1 Tax=Rhododendron griersonianum TaxID=479676 RepID=A0AAV6L9X1_9ERIC|nr:hypothetical protein RHGRI_004691 [Rhododendron griersonianum]
MFEDFVHGKAILLEERVLKTVRSLDFFLESMGRSVKDFDLPIVDLTMAESRLTEKREILDELAVTVRLKHLTAIATATSGVAASLLPGGRTAHSRFKIPINGNESCTCNIPKQSGTAKLLRRAKLIIWDKALMAKRWEIESVDRSLRDVMSNDIIFGGKSIVFGGDFRQVLPVVP